MKYFKILFLTIIFISLAFIIYLFDGQYILGERAIDYASGDIDGDGEEEIVVLTKKIFSKYGKQVVIYSSTDNEIYRSDFSELNPWKVTIGDIDGDGTDEISIGVYKETIFHPIMDKRPFIYSFKDGGLHPKWRGSRLSRPFTEYIFYDIDENGVDEIISIEILENEEKLINTYKWKGFGFEGFEESKSYEDIDDLRIDNGALYIDVRDKGAGYKAIIKLRDNNITIKKKDTK